MNQWMNNPQHVEHMAEMMNQNHDFMQQMMAEMINDPNIRLQMLGHMTENPEMMQQMREMINSNMTGMMNEMMNQVTNAETAESRPSWLYKTSGAAALITGILLLIAVISPIAAVLQPGHADPGHRQAHRRTPAHEALRWNPSCNSMPWRCRSRRQPGQCRR